MGAIKINPVRLYGELPPEKEGLPHAWSMPAHLSMDLTKDESSASKRLDRQYKSSYESDLGSARSLASQVAGEKKTKQDVADKKSESMSLEDWTHNMPLKYMEHIPEEKPKYEHPSWYYPFPVNGAPPGW